jgi:hypothetical protein
MIDYQKKYFNDVTKLQSTQLTARIPNVLYKKLMFKLAEDGRKSYRSWLIENIKEYINKEIE